MGAGISAGAFAEGFYKGYSLIEKSMADKEERQRKIDADAAALKAKKDEMDIAASKFQNDTTKDIAKENTNLAKAEADGDVPGINAAKENITNLVVGSNKVSETYSKALGVDTKQIDINTLNLDKIESVEFNGNNYQVPVRNAEFIRGLIAKQNKEGIKEGQVPKIKVADDGTLRVMDSDGEGNTINKTMQAFKPLTRKDDKISFEEKGYNQWAAKPENKGKGIDEYKVYLKTSESMASESTKTASKQYVDKNGNLVRLTDWEISNRADKNELTEYKPEGESNSDKNLRFWEKANKKLKDTNPALYEQKKEEYMRKQTEANIAGVNYVGEQVKQQELDENTIVIEKAVTGETKNTKTDIATMESKQLNLYKKQDPDKYNELSAAKKEINQKKILVLELDSIIKDTQKYIGKKALKTGLYDNIDQKVRTLVGLTDETYINNIDVGTRLGVAQATLLKAMSGLTVNSNEAKLYEGWFKGGNFSDEKAVLAAVKSINNAMKRNIANVGYTYRADLPSTYLDSKTFTRIDIGKERANSNGSNKTITRTGKTPDGRRVIQYSDGTREYK